MVDADEQRLGVASVLGDLLETIAEGLELGSISNVTLEEDDGANAVVSDERCDVVINDVAVEANCEELHWVSVVRDRRALQSLPGQSSCAPLV